MAKKRSLIQQLPLAPIFGVMFGAAAATLVAATPQWLFDATVASSGLGDVLSVARPPLGIKARLLAIFVAFVAAALFGWLTGRGVERLVSGPRAPRVVEDDDTLDLAAFVADVPAASGRRRPIFADRELGAPLMSDAALTTAAAYTEPFPAFDPTLFEENPVEDEVFALKVRDNVPPAVEEAALELPDEVLQAPLAIEEFDVPPAPEEPELLPDETAIDALIRRLEAGLARRGAPPPPNPGTSAVVAAPIANPRDWMVRETDADAFDEDTTRALRTLRRMAG